MNDTASAGLTTALSYLHELVGHEVRLAFIDRGCAQGNARSVVYAELTDYPHPWDVPEGSVMFGLRDCDSGANLGYLHFFDDEPVTLERTAGLVINFEGGAAVEVAAL